MLNFIDTVGEAVAGIKDGYTLMIGGFGNAGQPFELIDALLDGGATDLTVVNNNAGQGDQGLALLIKEGRVRKIDPQAAEIGADLELQPVGADADRLRRQQGRVAAAVRVGDRLDQ